VLTGGTLTIRVIGVLVVSSTPFLGLLSWLMVAGVLVCSFPFGVRVGGVGVERVAGVLVVRGYAVGS